MSQTVGAALKAARERRQLTVAQVSESTRIRSHYLQALENDDISAMPSAAQARGFLRIYAEFLNLKLEKLIPPPSASVPPEASAPPDQPAAPTVTPSAKGSTIPLMPALTKLVAGWRQRLADRIAPRPEGSRSNGGTAPANDGAPPAADTEMLEPESPAPDKKKLT